MEVKITKRTKLCEQRNSMVHNFYYLIHGRIRNDARTRYRPFKFVVFFDVEDLLEYCDKDTYTNKDVKNMVDDTASCCFLDNIKSYDDCQYFYQLCRESLQRYNKLYRVWEQERPKPSIIF